MHHRGALLSLLLPSAAFAGTTDIELDTQVTQASSVNMIHAGPVNLISAEQLESVNIINAEDAVRDQPGVIVRKRYIGDPNATVGMRGSNMFQTARTLVFADGMPLHYLLQTRYSGAPRWQINRHSWASLGVDNLNNASAYVHHPYPQRTLFIEGGYRF